MKLQDIVEKILEVLYKYERENPGRFLHESEIKKRLPDLNYISENELINSLQFLEDKNLIEVLKFLGKNRRAKISPNGIIYFESTQVQQIQNFGIYKNISKKPIGGGGQAKIFKVENTETHQIYALKSYKITKKNKNKEIIKRYESEVEALRQLKGHKNIIRIFDWGIEDAGQYEYYYIVMEMADDNLDNLIKNGIKIEKKLEIFEQILSGVEYIHSKNSIHRDLKPKNILLKDEIVKISDFGITFTEVKERITRTDEWVGARFYMAPELEEGRDDNIDPRCDIYSLGKVLYFILSNGKIFNRENFDEEEGNLVNILNNRCFDCFNLFFKLASGYQKENRCPNISKLIEDFQNCKRDFELCPRVISFHVNLYENHNKLPSIDLPFLYDWLEEDLKNRLSMLSSPFYFIDDHRNGEFFGLRTVFHKLKDEEFDKLNLDWWEVGETCSFYELYYEWECKCCKEFLDEIGL